MGRVKGQTNSKKSVTKKITGPIEALPLKFESKKVLYVQVARSAKAVMYKLTNEDNHTYFEIFNIKHQPAFSLWSKPTKNKPAQEYKYPPKEKYPNNEAFGVWAWTYNTEKLAKECFNKISK